MSNMLKWFSLEHLPEDLRKVAEPIRDLAVLMEDSLPEGAEKTAGLRKLLEAKDCLVRAAVSGRPK